MMESLLGSQARQLWRELLHGARCGKRMIWSTVNPASDLCHQGDSSGQDLQKQFSPGYKQLDHFSGKALPQQLRSGYNQQLASSTGAIGSFFTSSVFWRRRYSAEASEDANKAELLEGDSFSMTRSFTEFDVGEYSKLCGDSNPIHRQSSAAKAAGFEGCVVHGMLYAGLFPAIIGSNFPGAIYVSQTLEFCTPVLVGENVVAQVEVLETKKLRRQYKITFATTCHKGTVLVLKDSVHHGGKSRSSLRIPNLWKF